MLPKKTRAKLVPDFRPIANIRLFYKVFALMILARVESNHWKVFNQMHNTLLRSSRRMEEHVLTTNVILKSRAAGLPL